LVRAQSGTHRGLPGEDAIATIEELEAQLAALKAAQQVPQGVLKLDLGCGTKKQPGFVGVDAKPFPGVDHVFDVGRDVWPFADNSVDEAFSSHSLEHVPAKEVDWELTPLVPPGIKKVVRWPRAHFFNELYRVLKPGAKATIITPHWNSCRAYGDITHEWPPVSEFFWLYLDKQWRSVNAPHDDMYSCDFTSGYGHSLHAALVGRNQEFVAEKLTWAKEAAQDMHATLVARK